MKPTTIKTAIMVSFGTMFVLTVHMSTSRAAVPGTETACDIAHPITMVISEDTVVHASSNQTLKVTFIGPITNANKLKRGGKQNIKVCEGAKLDYRVETAVGTVSCTLNKVPIAPQGLIKVEEGSKLLVCTNKPEGKDTDQYRIIGVNR